MGRCELLTRWFNDRLVRCRTVAAWTAIMRSQLGETLGSYIMLLVRRRNLQHNAALIRRPSQIEPYTRDTDEHLIEMPGISWPHPAATEPPGKVGTERRSPVPMLRGYRAGPSVMLSASPEHRPNARPSLFPDARHRHARRAWSCLRLPARLGFCVLVLRFFAVMRPLGLMFCSPINIRVTSRSPPACLFFLRPTSTNSLR